MFSHSLALCDWRLRSDRCVLTTSALVSFHLPFSNRTLDEILKIGIIRECFRVCFKSLLQDYVDTRQVLHKPLSTSAGRKHTCCNYSNIHPKILGKKEKKNSPFYSYLLWRVSVLCRSCIFKQMSVWRVSVLLVSKERRWTTMVNLEWTRSNWWVWCNASFFNQLLLQLNEASYFTRLSFYPCCWTD